MAGLRLGPSVPSGNPLTLCPHVTMERPRHLSLAMLRRCHRGEPCGVRPRKSGRRRPVGVARTAPLPGPSPPSMTSTRAGGAASATVAVARVTTPRRSTPRLSTRQRRRVAAGRGVRGRLIPMAHRGCPSPHPAMGTCRPFKTSVTGRCSWSALSPRKLLRRHALLWWRRHLRHHHRPRLCGRPPLQRRHSLRRHPPPLCKHLPLLRGRLCPRVLPLWRTVPLRCWGGEVLAPLPLPLPPRSGRGPHLPNCGFHPAPLPHRCHRSAAARTARHRSRRSTCWRGGPLRFVLRRGSSAGVPMTRLPLRWPKRWRPCWTFCRVFPLTSPMVGRRLSASAVGCRRCGRLLWSSCTRLRRGHPTAAACLLREVLCTLRRMGAAHWAGRRGRPSPFARWMGLAVVRWGSRLMDTVMSTRTGSAARTRFMGMNGGDDRSVTFFVWSSIRWAPVVEVAASGHRLRHCQTLAWAAVPVAVADGCGGLART